MPEFASVARLTDAGTRERLVRDLRRRGWLRDADLRAAGIHPRWLRRLQDEGLIERVRAGLYRASEAPHTTQQTLYEACAAVPEGVICLTSALVYHELTTANPPVIDMAILRDRWRPKVAYPPIHFYEFRPRLMALGLQRVRGPRGTELRVFDPERAICDAFRLRRVVGSDLALEALRAYLGRRGRRHLNELLGMARETRVLRHIRPYVEALT